MGPSTQSGSWVRLDSSQQQGSTAITDLLKPHYWWGSLPPPDFYTCNVNAGKLLRAALDSFFHNHSPFIPIFGTLDFLLPALWYLCHYTHTLQSINPTISRSLSKGVPAYHYIHQCFHLSPFIHSLYTSEPQQNSHIYSWRHISHHAMFWFAHRIPDYVHPRYS